MYNVQRFRNTVSNRLYFYPAGNDGNFTETGI